MSYQLPFRVSSFFIGVAIILSVSTTLRAQQITMEDYKRALSFAWDQINDKQVFNLYMPQGFFADSSGLWQVNHSANGKEFQVIWFDSLVVKQLFDHKAVATQLESLLKDSVDYQNLPFDEIDEKIGSKLAVTIQEDSYRIDLNNNRVTKVKSKKKNRNYSPDSTWIAFAKDHNLYIKSQKSAAVFQLSSDGQEKFSYGNSYDWSDLMKGENGKRPDNFKVNWSSDSKWLWTYVCDISKAQKMYLLDWSVDTLYRPQLYSYYRGSPGDTTMVYETPVFYNIATKKEVKPRLKPRTHINTYWIEWIEGTDLALIIDSERGYQKLNFYLLNLSSGKLDLLFSESSSTRVGNKLEVEIFPKAKTFVFTSERSGWNQLYAFNLESKKTKALTSGDFVVNKIVRADTSSNQLYFMASGVNKKMNPYHQQLYHLELNNPKARLLTPEPLHHEIKFSPDGRYFTDKITSINDPARYTLRESTKGGILADIGLTDASSLMSKNWQPPQPFEAIGRDGKTKIYGVLWKPTNFDPTKSYPIIDHSYTGPHTQVFPTAFGEAFWGQQPLAELGFIVMMVDGLGTNGRSKAFQDVSYKNMGNNLLDHVGAIRQLGKRYNWIDTTKVGIYGHSAGGFDTGRGLLAFPDFYKVGVASSADHDFRMEKAWWPEMYMGWPVDSTYHKVSNITNAGNLKGKLLIVHGGMDENVNPSASFKLAEALIKANKDFDLLIIPSQHHGYKGIYRTYFKKKRWNYFVEHLLGAEPIWDIENK